MLTPTLTGDLLIAATVGAMATHVAWRMKQRSWVALDPLNAFWGGALVCYVLQPLTHGSLYVTWHGEDVFESTLAAVLISVIALIAGYESRAARRLALALPVQHGELRGKRMLLASAALIASGFMGYGILVASGGGLSTWLAHGRGGTDWASVSGYSAQLEHLLPVGVALLLFTSELRGWKGLARASAWACGVLQLLWLVYLGSRSRTIGFTLTFLSAYYLPRRRNPPLLGLAACALALLLVTNFQTTFRETFRNLSLFGEVSFSEALEASAPTWLGGQELTRETAHPVGSEFNCTATVVRFVPDIIDYNFGYSHLELITRPIPRAVWPDKIYPHSRAYTPIYKLGGLTSTPVETATEELLMGPAFTFVGHWYSVGGILALVAASVLTGGAFRVLRGLHDQRRSEAALIVYSATFPLGFWEAASEPLFWVYSLPFTLVPLLVLLRLCTVRARRSIPVPNNASSEHRRKIA